MGIYRLFGLRLAVPFGLPLPREATGTECDYRVEFAPGPPLPLSSAPALPRRLSQPLPGGWRLRFENTRGGWAEFRLEHREQCIHAAGSVPELEMAMLLLGPVIAALLSFRGHTLLHGTSLGFDGRALAIVGRSGHGKSTIAVGLIARGLALVSEDMTIVADRTVVPGYPLLRVGSEIIAALGADVRPLARVPSPDAGDDKHWLDVTQLPGGFCAHPLPLGAIYVLRPRDGGPARITPVAGARAVAELMAHRFAADPQGRTSHEDMIACAALAETFPVRVVQAEDRLDAVPDLLDALLANAARSGGLRESVSRSGREP